MFISKDYDEKEILKLLRHVCLGLNELHIKGIVHLDLKLENILISNTGKYKLGDLGLSRLMNKLHNDVPEGDCRYIAKELLNQNQEGPMPDLRTCDIFSLGILTYELMEKRRMRSNGQEWNDLREGKVTFTHPEIYSKEIKEMVRLMLSPNPHERPTASYLLQHYLYSDEERELKLCKKIIISLTKRLCIEKMPILFSQKDKEDI